MRVHVKLVAFSFSLFFLNYSQCQECLREDIKYENIEIAEKASYADGDTVRVNCMTGYIGLYKLKCEKGEWKTSIGRPCAKKKCSIPGDIANGDFKLTEGTEFAFGAKVVYTCKKGYEMTSRVNHLTCTAQGWDNTLPVCEAVKCPAIHTDGNVTASGNTEKGRYGDVIHFECVSSDKKIDGSNDIHCKETGEWSDVVPTCKEIRCEVPRDQHVYRPSDDFSGNMKFGETKSYRCESGYRQTAAEATCTRDGWTPDPLCAEATCLLQLNRTVGDLRIEGLPGIEGPVKPGHKLTFSCTGEGMKLNGERDITCLSNREWSSPFPKCQEIACEGEQLFNVEILFGHPSFVSPYKPGHVLLFRCTDENLKLHGRRAIECQSDGKWDYPYPTCREIRCEVPRDQHVYRPSDNFRGDMKLGERRSYRCESGYRQTAAEATCTRDGWTPDPLCAEIICEVPRDQHVYRPYDYFRGDMKLGTTKSYRCESGYRKTAEKATCTRDGWTPDPLCAEITCVLQSTTSGVKKIIPERKTIFRAGESVEIICSGGSYNSKDTRKSFACQENGEWDHKPACGEIRCEVPRDQNVYRPGSYFSGDLKLETRKTYYCENDYHQTEKVATCTQDGWTPKPLCPVITVPGKCGPPPPVDNGDTTDITKKEYNTGERVEFICFNKYTLDTRPPFSRYLTCQQGEWSGNIKCLKPCTVTVEIMNERGIELAFTGDQKLFAPHDDHLTFKCQWGKRSVVGSVDFRQKCNDGVMTLPKCV